MLVSLKCLIVPKKTITFNSNVIRKFFTTLKKPSHVQWILSHEKLLHKEPINKKYSTVKGIQENISALQMKKRPLRKKRIITDDEEMCLPGFWSVKALATAEEYNLENLMDGLLKLELLLSILLYFYFIPDLWFKNSAEWDESFFIVLVLPDAIQVKAKYKISNEPREIYFFREGTTVLWNITDLECSNLLQFLKKYEENSYSNNLVQAEGELLHYTYTESGKRSHLKEGDIFLSPDANLDKYTFSNAISQSVKLGIWEATLDHYVHSIEFITEDLKAGQKIKMSREEVWRKQGELFALRHFINLSSDLLDTPDFYWERDDLETLYQQTCAYFSIAKRTRVMNEKLNHCVELVGLLSSHLSDRHHIRLEWMIIILIMVEVGFEIVHYLDRYLIKQEDISFMNQQV